MNLYEIEEEIMECIDEETGEVVDIEKLDQLFMERDKKIENIALWIKNLRADAAAYKAEKESFEKKRKAAENKANSLSNYLMGFLNGEKFQNSKVTISYRKSEELEITSGENIPFEYIKYTPEVKKAELKKAIKEGLEVEGCKVLEKNNIQVK